MTSIDPITTSDGALIERVQKLLAMAERTENREEADAFSRKAAHLIARHRLTDDALRTRRSDDLVIQEVSLGRGAYVRARYHLLAGIAEAYGCIATFMSAASGTIGHVTGHRNDADTVLVLYTSLHQQMSARAASERRSTPASTQRFRRSFMFGFAAEIAVMMKEAHSDAVASHPDPSSLHPVLVDRAERVQRFADDRLGRIVTARPAAPAVRDGVAAGRRAAIDADIGRTRISARPALGSGAGR